MWASVLTNQYLNPEPKYMFRLYCGDEKGRDSLEQLAVITEQKGALFWESYAEKRSYALSGLTDWDTLVPKDPCNPDDRFPLARIVEFEGTLYFVEFNFLGWERDYVLQIPDYNPLSPWERSRREFGTNLLIIWGVLITLNYFLFGVFRFLP